MDKGYGEISGVNLKDVKFVLTCKTHANEPPIELDIEHTAAIRRCHKCNQQSPPVPVTASEDLLQMLKTTLKKIREDKNSTVELRMEFAEGAIKKRDR
jgi:hypothetical protein